MSDDAAARAARLRRLSALSDFAAPTRIGVAVSGGGDSMALLDLMIRHGHERGIPVHAVTVDHGLRPGSAEEAAYVATYCAERDIPHDILLWDGWDGAGNLPARARAARYGLIAGWARRTGIDLVALGHTRDDVAETFLMRLSRAAGVDGLAAMPRRFEAHGLAWERPLLQCARQDLRAYLTERGIAWREDPSNDDLSYDRPRARNALRTLETLGIDSETLARTAANLQVSRRALEHYAAIAAAQLVTQDRGDLILQRHPPAPCPAEIHRRLLVKALQWVGGAEYPPRRSAVENLLSALSRAGRATAAGCHVTAAGSTFRVAREYNAVSPLTCPTEAIWDGRWRLDGPHAPDLRIGALGEDVTQCPAWRETGLPRASLLASPAIRRGETLVAAPLAGLSNGWAATVSGAQPDFNAYLLKR